MIQGFRFGLESASISAVHTRMAVSPTGSTLCAQVTVQFPGARAFRHVVPSVVMPRSLPG